MQAMIFAAGLGTRLRPLTNDRPKALVEVEGKSLLEHNILKLKASGCDRLIVNVHHFADQVIEFLKSHDNFGIDIQVSDERDLLLDTGGGIAHALKLFDLTKPILIHNVDIISDIDLAQLYQSHQLNRNNSSYPVGATLAVNRRNTSRYLMFDNQFNLCGWTNKQTGEIKGEEGISFAFSGIHIIDPIIFHNLMGQPEEVFPIIPFYLSVCRNYKLHGVEVTTNKWVDCGKPEALVCAADILKSLR